MRSALKSEIPNPNPKLKESEIENLCSQLWARVVAEHLTISNRQNASLNRYREHNADATGKGTDAADDSGDGG